MRLRRLCEREQPQPTFEPVSGKKFPMSSSAFRDFWTFFNFKNQIIEVKNKENGLKQAQGNDATFDATFNAAQESQEPNFTMNGSDAVQDHDKEEIVLEKVELVRKRSPVLIVPYVNGVSERLKKIADEYGC